MTELAKRLGLEETLPCAVSTSRPIFNNRRWESVRPGKGSRPCNLSTLEDSPVLKNSFASLQEQNNAVKSRKLGSKSILGIIS